MTSQGSPITVLRRAIRSGSLRAVETALADVPQLDLQDALEIVLLMADADDARFDRWATRWVDRASTEERDRLATLLERLPDETAAAALRTRAEELRQAHPAAQLHLP